MKYDHIFEVGELSLISSGAILNYWSNGHHVAHMKFGTDKKK